MNTKLLHGLGPLMGLILFSVALWGLHHDLNAYHFSKIVRNLKNLPAHHLLTAFFLTFLSYIVMTGYDILAIKYIQYPLEYPKIALASFIGYALSNNIGLPMIAGASVRYQLYSGWELSGPPLCWGTFSFGCYSQFCRPHFRQHKRNYCRMRHYFFIVLALVFVY